jgi:hypothetical protein
MKTVMNHAAPPSRSSAHRYGPMLVPFFEMNFPKALVPANFTKFHPVPRNSMTISSKSPVISNISKYFHSVFGGIFYTKIFLDSIHAAPRKKCHQSLDSPADLCLESKYQP